MAGRYGSNSITITMDDAPGGTGRVITPYVTEIGGFKKEAIIEQTDAFSAEWEEHTPTGKKKSAPISIKGWYDTTATVGPHVVFADVDDGPQDATRTLAVGIGDSKTWSAECRLVSYEIIATNGKLTQYEAMVQPTGAVSLTA